MIDYIIFETVGIHITHQGGGKINCLTELSYPPDRFAILPAKEVPENWRDMTIVDGALVLAPAEILEARRAARQQAELETVRAARESRYRAETDALMFDAMEAYAIAHPEDPAFAAWLTAKNRIRTELPKPKEGGGE